MEYFIGRILIPATHFESPPGDFKPWKIRSAVGWNLTVPAAGVLDYQVVPSNVRALPTFEDMVIDLYEHQNCLDEEMPPP